MEYFWYLCAGAAVLGVAAGIEVVKVNRLLPWVIVAMTFTSLVVLSALFFLPHWLAYVIAMPGGILGSFFVGSLAGSLLCILNFGFGKWKF